MSEVLLGAFFESPLGYVVRKHCWVSTLESRHSEKFSTSNIEYALCMSVGFAHLNAIWEGPER